MKLYTGGGDAGRTSLFSGERVGKDDPRVDAYGALDELNSTLGVAAAALPAGQDELAAEIRAVQADLLTLGSLLATSEDSPRLETLPRIGEADQHRLEEAIDRMTEAVPPLTGFVLPGGHLSAATTHVARTVCRRMERRMTTAYASPDTGEFPEHLVGARVFVNRLSDYLFALARYCNHVTGTPDTLRRG